MKAIRLKTAVVLLALLVAFPGRAAAYHDGVSPISQYLVLIGNKSRIFRKHIERIIFSRSFISVEQNQGLARMARWADGNSYPRLTQFLDVLTEEDVEKLFTVFMKGQDVKSAASIPVIESKEITGQEVALNFPFRGEFFVVQGNHGWVSHKDGTGNEFAWDFTIQTKTGMVTGSSAKNENYHAWGRPVVAPAAGTVVETRTDQEDHVPMTTKLNKSNFVKIDHGYGEISNIHHLMKDSIVVKKGDRVARGDVLGKVGNSGISMFPHIHYQLDFTSQWSGKKRPAVFACYFSRSRTDDFWHLEISGSPADGDYVMSVDDYLDSLEIPSVP